MTAAIRIRTTMFILALLSGSISHAEAGTPQGSGAQAPASLSLHFESADFELIRKADGLRIEIKGYGLLQDPGKPLLPLRNSLFLLPPGARDISLTVNGVVSSKIPGFHDIAPASPQLVLPDAPDATGLQRKILAQWAALRAEAYARDQAYPPEPVWISSAGSLRDHPYVALSWAPFAYHPLSGRLVQHERVDVQIHYNLPGAGSEEETHADRFAVNAAADARAARLFENYQDLAHLYWRGREAGGGRDDLYDYLIITTANCETAVNVSGFLDWKVSRGFNPRVILTTDLEIASQPGVDLPARIRNFLRLVYGPWGVEYVLLVGTHESIPMRYCFPDPTNHEHNPGSPGDPGGSKPSDCYYADLSLTDADSWDLDGDGFYGEYGDDMPDFLSEVSVGRIPSSVPGDIYYALQKIIRYEEDTGDWKDRALHGGAILYYENQDGLDIPFRDGAVLIDLIESGHMSGWTIDHYCEHEGLVPSSYDWPALTHSAFTAAWRSGQWGVVNWAGHGASDDVWRLIWTWDDGDGVFNTDGSDGYDWLPILRTTSELEDDYPSIVYAVSCSVGYPEVGGYGNLGIDLLTRPGFGAAAGIISATRSAHITAYWPDVPGASETRCLEFNRFLIDGPDGPERLGDAHFDSKFHCFVNYGLTSYREYSDQYVFNLYGDPAMDRKGPVASGIGHDQATADTPGMILRQNRPNPFNPETQISFHLPRASLTEVSIYDVSGRLLSSLFTGHLNAGWHELRWTGVDDDGATVPSGVYFCRVTSDAGSASKKMTLLK